MLVLSPTRELATQITKATELYGKHIKRLSVVSILGGMPYHVQNKLLSKPIDILVATPGRLMDQMDRGRLDFSRLEILVLDEADRMLDMGFIEPVERIAAATPKSRQTLLFSATLEGRIAKLAQNLLKNPKLIEVTPAAARHDNIEQRMIYADDLGHKNKLLSNILLNPEMSQAIVFMATKRECDVVARQLHSEGFYAAAMHGDMQQRERNFTLAQLRSGKLKVLVATDVAARGIDVPGLSHVINYDLPKAAEDYVHRIGRTGRAGAKGIAISFAGPRDGLLLKRIERYTGSTVNLVTIPGLEVRSKPRDDVRAGRCGSFGNKGARTGGFADKSPYANKTGFNKSSSSPARRDDRGSDRSTGAPARSGNGNGNGNGSRDAANTPTYRKTGTRSW